MCAAFCSCATETNRIPASGKRSCASMYADPTMPNVSLTPCASSVSMKASLGVILTLAPATAVLGMFLLSTMMFMGNLLWRGAQDDSRAQQSTLVCRLATEDYD